MINPHILPSCLQGKKKFKVTYLVHANKNNFLASAVTGDSICLATFALDMATGGIPLLQ